MFNLLISGNPEAWDSKRYDIEKCRFTEHTAGEIKERYNELDKKLIDELKTFPTIFAIEREDRESKIGRITNILLREGRIYIDFEFDDKLPALPIGTLKELAIDLDIADWEFFRTHWAIKDEPLFDLLIKKNLISRDVLLTSKTFVNSLPPEPKIIHIPPQEKFNSSQVFIVHCHDHVTMQKVRDFVEEIGLEPIILSQQASSSKTIIEKIESYSNVGFGIVLYTPCDVGTKKGNLQYHYRARQNVVFEHGFLIGKLERKRVVALTKDGIETPNDISGIIYIKIDDSEEWKKVLLIEMKEQGLLINDSTTVKE
jgi:hypothetical protein